MNRLDCFLTVFGVAGTVAYYHPVRLVLQNLFCRKVVGHPYHIHALLQEGAENAVLDAAVYEDG